MSYLDELQKLKTLLDDGVINSEEYKEHKARILSISQTEQAKKKNKPFSIGLLKGDIFIIVLILVLVGVFIMPHFIKVSDSFVDLRFKRIASWSVVEEKDYDDGSIWKDVRTYKKPFFGLQTITLYYSENVTQNIEDRYKWFSDIAVSNSDLFYISEIWSDYYTDETVQAIIYEHTIGGLTRSDAVLVRVGLLIVTQEGFYIIEGIETVYQTPGKMNTSFANEIFALFNSIEIM